MANFLEDLLRWDPKNNPTPIEYGTIPQGQEGQFEDIGTLNEPMFRARTRGINGPPPERRGMQAGPIIGEGINPFGEDDVSPIAGPGQPWNDIQTGPRNVNPAIAGAHSAIATAIPGRKPTPPAAPVTTADKAPPADTTTTTAASGDGAATTTATTPPVPPSVQETGGYRGYQGPQRAMSNVAPNIEEVPQDKQALLERFMNWGGGGVDVAGDWTVGAGGNLLNYLREVFRRPSEERAADIAGTNQWTADAQAETHGRWGTRLYDFIDDLGDLGTPGPGTADQYLPEWLREKDEAASPPAQAAVNAEAGSPNVSSIEELKELVGDENVKTVEEMEAYRAAAPPEGDPAVAPISSDDILADAPPPLPLPPPAPDAPTEIESADLAGRVKDAKELALGRVTVPQGTERFGMSKEQVLDFAQAMIDENPSLITEGVAGVARRLQGFDEDLILIIQNVIEQLNNPGQTGTDLG